MIMEGTTVEIPDSMIVEGDLNLWNTKVTELPGGLKVGGGLFLHGSKVVELPAGLVVGGYLNLHGSKVVELPEVLSVGGSLYVDAGHLIASEKTQLEWIAKGADMLQKFKAPTEKSQRLHKMLWIF